MFDKLRRSSAAKRLIEEQFYEQVVSELSNGKKRDGLWAKALADSKGSEEKAKALYIQYRVQSIKDEMEISEAVAEEEEHLRKNASVIARQERINNAEALLRSKGHKPKVKSSGWLVIEPLGGWQKISTLEELEQYANSRE